MPNEFSAGAVVLRRLRGRWWLAAIRPGGKPEGVWALPKGNISPGDSPADTALREVEEETGVRGTLGPELEATRYRDRNGRMKQVRYWLMEPADGESPPFRPNDEIDDVRWCSPVEAGKLLHHEHDRNLIGDAEALP